MNEVWRNSVYIALTVCSFASCTEGYILLPDASLVEEAEDGSSYDDHFTEPDGAGDQVGGDAGEDLVTVLDEENFPAQDDGDYQAVQDSQSTCPCLKNTDNYCFYPRDTPGCDMVKPGGYCDPNGDGDFSDGDWQRGWYEYKNNCPWDCGDGGCNSPSENCSNCPADCGTCQPVCGDGKCDSGENCQNCPGDCGNCQPSCGDRRCDAGEDCRNCPADCGTCPPACGDGKCDAGENCLSCPGDCPRGTGFACNLLGGQDLGGSPGFPSFLGGCPRIAKWLGGAGSEPGSGFAQFDEMAAYKCFCGGITVLRIYGPAASYPTGDDLWNARYRFLEYAQPWQKAAVDYLESDNECDAGHCFYDPNTFQPSPERAADYAGFLQQWTRRAVAAGFRPLVLNLAVGNPGGDVDNCDGDGMRTFGALLPAIRDAHASGGAWAYHSYTADWSTEAQTGMAPYLAFRYRKFVRCFPELASVPLIFTEAGFDRGGNPDRDGFLANGGWSAYEPWLRWYQGEIAKDSYVRGALLFAFAPAGSWSSFRLDDYETSLRAIIGPPNCSK